MRGAALVARPDLHDWSGGAGVLTDRAGEWSYLQGSGIRRDGREQIPAPSAAGLHIGDRVDVAIFGGYLYDHYGHFLLESLARLWPPDAPAPDIPVVWIAAWSESLAPWMSQVLDAIGAPRDRRVVTTASGALAVDELVVASPGFEFRSFMHPWLAARLARCRVDPGDDHVWLSRSAARPHSGLDEDLDLEAALEDDGWTIARPEELSIPEQLALIGSAVHVAGIEGSAFHTFCLLRGYRGVIDLFTRQDHPNFDLVADAAGLDQRRHRIPGAIARERPKPRGTDVQWSGVDIEATVSLLRATCRRHGHRPPSS